MDEDPGSPPADANDWSDEQWIEWLQATDVEAPGTNDPAAPMRRPVSSVGGQLLGNAMLGLARALYGTPDEKPAIVVQSDDPEGDQPLELHLDFEHPKESFVVLRSDTQSSE